MILTISILIAIVLHALYASGSISKKTVCFCIGVMTFLLIGLRSTTTGGDTQIYYLDFLSINAESLSTTLSNSPMKDMGFIVFEWFIKYMGGTYRTLLLINGLVAGFAIGKVFYRYAENPGLSYVLLFSFNIFQFFLSGIRQTFAIAFVIFAVLLYEEKKYLKSGLWLLLAGAFHLSALIVIVVPILQFLFKNPRRIKFAVPFMLASFIFRNQMATTLSNILFSISDRMSTEILPSDEGVTMTLVIITLYIGCVLYAVPYCKTTNRGVAEFALLTFAVFFEALVPAKPLFFRIAFYGLWVLAILIPKIIRVVFAKSSQTIVSLFAYGMALIMYFGYTMNSVYGGYHFLT